MAGSVIVVAGRSLIGRAGKGSLVSCRPDDLAAFILQQVRARVPGLDPTSVEV